MRGVDGEADGNGADASVGSRHPICLPSDLIAHLVEVVEPSLRVCELSVLGCARTQEGESVIPEL